MWITCRNPADLRHACEGAWRVAFEAQPNFLYAPGHSADAALRIVEKLEGGYPIRVFVIPGPGEEPEREWQYRLLPASEWFDLHPDRVEEVSTSPAFRVRSRAVVRGGWEDEGVIDG